MSTDNLICSSSGTGTEPPATKEKKKIYSERPQGVWLSLSPDMDKLPQQLHPHLAVFALFPLGPRFPPFPATPSPQSSELAIFPANLHSLHFHLYGHLPSQILWVGWKLSRKRNICLCSFSLAHRHTSQVPCFTIALIIAFPCISGGRTVENVCFSESSLCSDLVILVCSVLPHGLCFLPH